jgi:hypothetical protein
LTKTKLIFLMFLIFFRPHSTFSCRSRGSARPPP